jgi:excinuclease ABC subunit C
VVVGPAMRERAALVAEALQHRRDGPVEVRVAERGDKRRLRELAEKNAKLALGQDRLRRERRRQQRVDALSALQDALGIEELPVRIEGFDISNLGAQHTVASMVVFEGGAPKKAHYRRFKIRDSENGRPAAPDDYRAIEQVLSRRIARWQKSADLSPHDAERDESFAGLPGLIVIDGGKGQLSAGMRALGPLVERGVTVIGLAKRLEEVYLPGRGRPVPIPRDSEALRLLQRVRDEAHRFAIEFHRSRRDKAMTGSVFDELRGVGPVRKRALLSHFGSPDRFLAASLEELEAVPGIPAKVGREIHRQLHRTG